MISDTIIVYELLLFEDFNSEEELDALPELSPRRRKAIASLRLGKEAASLKKWEEAKNHFSECKFALDARRMNNPRIRKELLECQGDVALATNSPGEAVSYYKATVKLHGEDAEAMIRARLLAKLSQAGLQMQHWNEAIQYAEQGLLLAKGGSIALEGNLCILLALAWSGMGERAKARKYAQRARMLGMTKAKLVLARLALEAGDLAEARACCLEGLEGLEKLLDEQLRGSLLFVLGQIAQAINRPSEAQEYYLQALTLCSLPEQRKVLQQLALMLEQQGKEDQALEYWKKIYRLAGQTQ